MTSLRRLTALALATVLVFSGAALAQTPAEATAEVAMERLSARYQQIWSTLTPSQKQAFSSSERRWLNSGRWDEQKQCVARHITVDPAAVAAQCQAAIIERRLQQLGEPQRQAALL